MKNLNHHPKYAGFSMRILASVIDSLLSVIVLIPFVALFRKIYGSSEMQSLLVSGNLKPEDISKQQMIDFLTTQLLSFTYQNIIACIVVIMFWIYCSATPGKILLNMQIVDDKTGQQPTKKQFIIRYIGYLIALLPLGLGFIWIHYDKKKQGWHDKMAGTVVIYKSKKVKI